MTTGLIETPEVNLYYTMRGEGPMLLILQGGAGNADGSEALANALADRFTVITYDRRGLSRSRPAQAEGCEIATHASDAAHLIAALSSEPVFLFGSSMGALIGIVLAVDYGERVRMLVAHEPPLYRLLQGDEQEEALRSHMELQQTFQQEGLPAAMKLMITRSGVDFNDREPEVPTPLAPSAESQAAAQRFADLQYFFKWDVPAVTRYQPNLVALTTAASRIVPAVGVGSGSTRPYRCTIALAEFLNASAVEFQGGHTGYVLRPNATAKTLSELFCREKSASPVDRVNKPSGSR
jgi:pimeloyl-ACP methyl ester carboxylesterase